MSYFFNFPYKTDWASLLLFFFLMDLQPKLILSNYTAYKSIALLGHKHPRQNSSTHFRNVISIWIIIVVDLVS